MKKVITYGTYDLLHHGHIALLKRAKSLGDYLIVGVTSDIFDKERGKLNVKQSLAERIEAVQATGIADQIIVEEYEGQKVSDIQKYDIDIFTVGSDWYGKFDYLQEYCDVIYLPRTKGISSTELRVKSNPEIKIGIWGIGITANRIYDESLFVSGMEIISVFDEDKDKLEKFCRTKKLLNYTNIIDFLDEIDAVYIESSVNNHFDMIMLALEHNCHVISSPPIFLNCNEAKEAFSLAEKKHLVLFEGIKTLYFPAFERLLLLTKTETIGLIKDIDVSCSQIPENIEYTKQNKYLGSIYDWCSTVMLPIIKILGTDLKDFHLYTFEENNFNYFTRGVLNFPNATASFKVGKGIKFEGELIITGTKGYIYVPAPWWNTDYFEIRYEDLRNTKKYFYNYEGSGLRYMLLKFVQLINDGLIEDYEHKRLEIFQSTRILEYIEKQKKNITKLC